ncbi:X polypeptide domain protein [Escherichia coli 2-427-07_S4_C1]|nr:hypothetical protein G2583_pO550013 [Escherichia coli O55:H7 str. CB9615]EHV22675.1 hypothetical protein ECDEC5A_3657 [Escherichia coli DEC5A]EHV32445.1 hypothetical protein ECDEC5D_5276 [Escherichia coli DEC5D]EHV47291.1 hypothetical protein ECDEC5C_5470 [Escherichia coli DEC5C]EHX14821.1 hypothetical protein ECDEC11C_1630 [Escherichia coli DEC11C]EKI02036.1 hypothetical protein EC5905_0519 [Escherichia coli 5905]EKI33968.1 hypothetical protein EC07798_5086 [Escherichia coli 07798]KDY398
MEGHTQKYHMSDNTDWPKPREAGNAVHLSGAVLRFTG